MFKARDSTTNIHTALDMYKEHNTGNDYAANIHTARHYLQWAYVFLSGDYEIACKWLSRFICSRLHTQQPQGIEMRVDSITGVADHSDFVEAKLVNNDYFFDILEA